MERRGVYRKGSAGHSRNINPYMFYRQRLKKWRLPLTVIIALVFVFGLAPSVGDQFQGSVLNSEGVSIETDSPEQLRKNLMNAVKEVTDACDRFVMTVCVEEGTSLMKELVDANQPLEESKQKILAFIARMQPQLAVQSCKFDLGALAVQGRAIQEKGQSFLDRYGDSIDSAALQEHIQTLTKAFAGIDAFVDGCRSR